jgi:succinoglycan biosynthesis protein ExoO
MAERHNGAPKVDVSVIVANYNGEKFIADALRSACNQSLRNIEIIVSDDASADSSVQIVERLIAEDNRIRLIQSPVNCGAAAARNRALDVAKGDWISIFDSDDLMHPDRICSLVEEGTRSGADIVADDLLLFDTDRRAAPKALFKGSWARSPSWVSAEDYLITSHFYGRGPAFGYLKPVIRASVIAEQNLRYDERLTIAEDFNFVFRLLMAGAKFRTLPQIGYFYRRHSGSISHRLNSDALQRIVEVEKGWAQRWSLVSPSLFRSRERSVKRAIIVDKLVLAIKSKQVVDAAILAITNPAAAWLLRLPIGQFVKGLYSTPKSSNSRRRQVCILTRQRVVGRTNGSSRYLLDIATFLVERGLDMHLVVPSPSTMGRWPFLKLSDDMAIFKSIKLRGTVRIGRYVVACDPRVLLKGALGLLDRFPYRKGVIARPLSKRAPYASAQPLDRKDQIFIAREAPSIADVLIADYCFLTDAYPYALRPDARRVVIMHDLLSRSSQFATLNALDSIRSISLTDEVKMLAAAETIVAIQRDEAAILQCKLPNHEILVAPIAALPVNSPQIGTAEIVLFVGSSAAPNVDGIKWFIESCWAIIRERRPQARLHIAGSVCDTLARAPAATRLFNVVESLDELYAEASVVISPLRAGSGLKIKLIEALSKGKAVVATTATLQGVADLLSDCTQVSDSAQMFASMVIDLLANEGKRNELGAKGLSAVSQHFAPERAYGAIATAVERRDPTGLDRFCAS